MKYVAFVLAVVALTGCSVLPKQKVETRYVLAPAAVEVVTTHSGTLMIARPVVPVNLRSNQIVLMQGSEQTVYAGKAWAAPVPDMLASSLSRDLTGALPGWIVTTDTTAVASPLELQLDVHDFATVQNDKDVSVVMNIDVRVVDTQKRTVIRHLPFRYRTNLKALTTDETLAAYNKGWAELVKGIAQVVAGVDKF